MKKICKYCLKEKDYLEFKREFGKSISICKKCQKIIEKNANIKHLAYKICEECYYNLPVINFDKSSKSKDGYFSICKACKDNKKKFKKAALESYGKITCEYCNTEKESKEFYFNRNKLFTKYCKECLYQITSYEQRINEKKICNGCGKEKVACNENFRISIYKKGGFLRNTCLICEKR